MAPTGQFSLCTGCPAWIKCRFVLLWLNRLNPSAHNLPPHIFKCRIARWHYFSYDQTSQIVWRPKKIHNNLMLIWTNIIICIGHNVSSSLNKTSSFIVHVGKLFVGGGVEELNTLREILYKFSFRLSQMMTSASFDSATHFPGWRI